MRFVNKLNVCESAATWRPDQVTAVHRRAVNVTEDVERKGHLKKRTPRGASDSSSHCFIQLLTSQERRRATFFSHCVDATLKKRRFQTNTGPSSVICKRQRESHLDRFAWNIQMKQVQSFFFCLFVVSQPLINIHTHIHFKKNKITNGQKKKI